MELINDGQAIQKLIKETVSENEIIKSINTPEYDIKSPIDKIKKETEILLLKKFLIRTKEKIEIVNIGEKPDFEISNKDKRIGLELTSIANRNDRLIFIEKLFIKVEHKIQLNYPSLKFLFNCYFNQNLIVTSKSINKQSIELYELITPEINGKLGKYGKIIFEDNEYLDSITYMRDGKTTSLFPNNGADYENEITQNQVNDIINKKDKLINDYQIKFDENWLLIYIHTESKLGNLSMPDDIKDLNRSLIENSFDKIYLLHWGKVYCLK